MYGPCKNAHACVCTCQVSDWFLCGCAHAHNNKSLHARPCDVCVCVRVCARDAYVRPNKHARGYQRACWLAGWQAYYQSVKTKPFKRAINCNCCPTRHSPQTYIHPPSLGHFILGITAPCLLKSCHLLQNTKKVTFMQFGRFTVQRFSYCIDYTHYPVKVCQHCYFKNTLFKVITTFIYFDFYGCCEVCSE